MLILHKFTAFLVWLFGAEASRQEIALAIKGWSLAGLDKE